MKASILAAAFALLAGTTQAFADSIQPSADSQKSLTPDSVLSDLMSGNERFVTGQITDPNIKARRGVAVNGQFPKAYVLSCVDSRVPVEQVFDQGIGDIFVGRVAGNFENVDQLGSMEFAAAVAGVKVILVLGHESCGAVKGACDGVEMGNLTELLDEIEPAIWAVDGYSDDRTSKNKPFVEEVIRSNVSRTVLDIRRRSPVLADMEASGKLKIVGAVFSLKTGQVSALEAL